MKKLLLAFLISNTSFAIETDKVAHFGMSYFLNTAGYTICSKVIKKEPCKYIAPLVTLGIGVLKESTDSEFSHGDLLANGIGITFSVITINFGGF